MNFHVVYQISGYKLQVIPLDCAHGDIRQLFSGWQLLYKDTFSNLDFRIRTSGLKR